ncbi:unnamed protein product [Adineta ricciae]|uniref:Uncharacterized protein n=1 Tax=Adineta ricciae TaxID=249248 RepID=A0A815ANP9_ADIRI|nr:unnamed protein product [Adineta ricciae]CAF1260450.1 unnamed protein product [Adineta ricciae]
MASEQLDLNGLLQAVSQVLTAFHFPNGSSLIERVMTNRVDDATNTQLLANLKQEASQLPPLTTIEMSGEMRCFIQAVIDSIKATDVIDKRFVTRSIGKIYRGFEPFVRNEIQRLALIDMEATKEDALNIEPRHRISHKLRTATNDNQRWLEDEGNDDDLHMTRELQAAAF